MNGEEKELIKEFKEELNEDLKDIENVNDTFLMVTMHNIEIIVNLIEKQEKVIDEMSEVIHLESDYGCSLTYCPAELENGILNFDKCNYHKDCLKCVKEYFYKEVENNE